MTRTTHGPDAIVKAIQKAFKATGWSLLKLSRTAELPYATVYDTIKHGQQLKSESASAMLKVLDIEVRPKAKRKG